MRRSIFRPVLLTMWLALAVRAASRRIATVRASASAGAASRWGAMASGDAPSSSRSLAARKCAKPRSNGDMDCTTAPRISG